MHVCLVQSLQTAAAALAAAEALVTE
jgi:hypothetical protein